MCGFWWWNGNDIIGKAKDQLWCHIYIILITISILIFPTKTRLWPQVPSPVKNRRCPNTASEDANSKSGSIRDEKSPLYPASTPYLVFLPRVRLLHCWWHLLLSMFWRWRPCISIGLLKFARIRKNFHRLLLSTPTSSWFISIFIFIPDSSQSERVVPGTVFYLLFIYVCWHLQENNGRFQRSKKRSHRLCTSWRRLESPSIFGASELSESLHRRCILIWWNECNSKLILCWRSSSWGLGAKLSKKNRENCF